MANSREPEGIRLPPTRTSRSQVVNEYGQPVSAPSHRPGLPTNPQPDRRPRGSSPGEDRPSGRYIPLLAVVGLTIVGVLAYLSLNGEDDVRSAEVIAPASTAADQAVDGTDESTADTQPEAAAPVVGPPVAPFVRATLAGKDLSLDGTVPSEELKAGLLQASELVYAPFVVSDVQVDNSLAAPEWLAAAPQVVMLLQTISEGTIVISEGRISVTGRTGSTDDVAELQRYLTEATGLPVDMGDIEITGLREPVYLLAGKDGQVALSGALPNEEVRLGVVAAAVALYGEDNVFDASTIDPGVDTALWMFNPEALMGVLAAFPDYEVRLNGGAFSASLSGGASFDTGSTEIKPALAQLLNFGIVVLTRDPSMVISVEGHTDSEGADDLNLQLSQARADAVAGYYAAGGIDPARITATGIGEVEPVASNDTAEGRARNRRVEFELTSSG